MIIVVNSCIECEKKSKSDSGDQNGFEEVFNKYRENPRDSLKYKAAAFLIENMDDKFSFSGEQYTKLLSLIDSLSLHSLNIEEYKSGINKALIGNKFLVRNLNKSYDRETVSAKFLIENIEDAFLAYESAPWRKSVDFDDFCEFVLPYRTGYEALELFRKQLYSENRHLLQNESLTILSAADSILSRTSIKSMDIISFPTDIPDLPLSSLKNLKGGTCRESSSLAIYMMRSVGLPVASDFTPYWPNRNGGHSWSSLIINGDSCIDFEGATSNMVGHHLRLSGTNRMAKAYRRTYAKQYNSLAMNSEGELIPEFFTNAYFQDVSSSYFETVDIIVEVPKNINNKFAYICVFNNNEWVPIHWGKIIDSKVVFTKMGKTAVYLPAIYTNSRLNPIDYPILVDSLGAIRRIISNDKVFQSLHLKRKYPVFDWWNTRTLAMKGGRFQASNNEDFSNTIDIFSITAIPEMTYQTKIIGQTPKFKYWRYLSPDSSYGDIAELEFYDEKDNLVGGNIIGTKSLQISTLKENVFDKDPLTYFQGDKPSGNWVGLAFNSQKKISKVRYLCRNDDNFIKNGEVYELYLWNNNEWKSLKSKMGDGTQILVYNEVPVDGLYLLRNHTKGKEERIFTYTEGKQIWW